MSGVAIARDLQHVSSRDVAEHCFIQDVKGACFKHPSVVGLSCLVLGTMQSVLDELEALLEVGVWQFTVGVHM